MGVYGKLEDFKSKVGSVKKDGNNPYHKSKYSTIESVLMAIEKPLSESGLVFTQLPQEKGLFTIICDIESGEKIESFVPYLMTKQDMQQLGSAITYARRYALVSMLGLEQEDDDGNSTINKPKKTEEQKQQNRTVSFREAKNISEITNFLNEDVKAQFSRLKFTSSTILEWWNWAKGDQGLLLNELKKQEG